MSRTSALLEDGKQLSKHIQQALALATNPEQRSHLLQALHLTHSLATDIQFHSLPAAGAGFTVPFKVLTFNIENGGDGISFDKIVEAVQVADPDVVCLSEACDSTGRLAEALGWKHYNDGMQIISKYPVFEPSGADGAFAFCEVRQGHVVVICNVHLPDDFYGPDALRDGADPKEVVESAAESALPAVEIHLEVLPELVKKGFPVIVTGDFNTPSHLDYGEDVKDEEVLWPVSQAFEAAGFRDSYRDVFPDPVANPGYTWPAFRPDVPDTTEDDIDWALPTIYSHDRIDYIYVSGPAKTVASHLMGEESCEHVDIAITPWPSDHRAVLSAFTLTPAPLPTMLSVAQRVVEVGEHLHVAFNSDDPALINMQTIRIQQSSDSAENEAPEPEPVVTVDISPEAEVRPLAFKCRPSLAHHERARRRRKSNPVPPSGLKQSHSDPGPLFEAAQAHLEAEELALEAAGEGAASPVKPRPEVEESVVAPLAGSVSKASTVKIPTHGLQPGHATAVLLDDNGDELASVSFYVQPADAELLLLTDKPVYQPGEPMEVSWKYGPGSRWDWIALTRTGDDPGANPEPPKLYKYANGSAAGTLPGLFEGSITIDENCEGDLEWPLPEGTYDVFYLLSAQRSWTKKINITVAGARYTPPEPEEALFDRLGDP
eukprot:CAMPEP_0114562864 /NCGR_PEP_ID=MMETSP0114-20121206/12765_1 /TAXON_ID=31324 /ORGANISM="Goniomonas sp, Strain m" /LENGTH=658 /DNA_ID=CAMNT_0001748595 /DNA_START=99 /DNA_END=2076 /DNA_ORIENTATION=-